MRDRGRDYAVLLVASALLSLPNLGAPALWDMDEGVNAQTTREMRVAGTWVIPTFNYHLRTAKPIMLYWLQRASYDAFGVSEWAARLPSVLAGWITVLLVYELARRMFGRPTGLLAGLILASVVQFAMMVHAATPDATLLAFTVLAYFAFWVGHRDGGRSWWYWMAAANALAFLTKGPIGLALPALVLSLYFIWNREVRRLFDHRMVPAAVVFLLIAGPWYTLVATETHGEWLRVFLDKENYRRFMTAMDRHAGTTAYYLVVVPLMFAPWSAFLIPLFWFGIKGAKRQTTPVEGPGISAADSPAPHPGETVRANRLLLCWIVGYLVFFSAAATKLPNYVLPIYPAMAILTARFLIGWRDGILAVPRWMPPATVGGVTMIGFGCIVCVLLGARFFGDLALWAFLGLVPLAAATGMTLYLFRGNRRGVVTTVTAAFLVFVGLAVAFPAAAIEPYKAPKELVRASGVDNPNRDIRVGQFEWLLPSVVYYSGREARSVPSEEKVVDFLADPTPAYLFVMKTTWENRLVPKVAKAGILWKVVAQHYDFLGKCEVVVVTNE